MGHPTVYAPIPGPLVADEAQTHDHYDDQMVERHVGQTGGAQLGAAAEVAMWMGRLLIGMWGRLVGFSLAPQLLKLPMLFRGM